MPQTSQHNNELGEFPELGEPMIYEHLSGMIDTEFTEMVLTISTQHNGSVLPCSSPDSVHANEDKLLWEGMRAQHIFRLFQTY